MIFPYFSLASTWHCPDIWHQTTGLGFGIAKSWQRWRETGQHGSAMSQQSTYQVTSLCYTVKIQRVSRCVPCVCPHPPVICFCHVSTQCFIACWHVSHDHIIHWFMRTPHGSRLAANRVYKKSAVAVACLRCLTRVSRAPSKGKATSKW